MVTKYIKKSILHAKPAFDWRLFYFVVFDLLLLFYIIGGISGIGHVVTSDTAYQFALEHQAEDNPLNPLSITDKNINDMYIFLFKAVGLSVAFVIFGVVLYFFTRVVAFNLFYEKKGYFSNWKYFIKHAVTWFFIASIPFWVVFAILAFIIFAIINSLANFSFLLSTMQVIAVLMQLLFMFFVLWFMHLTSVFYVANGKQWHSRLSHALDDVKEIGFTRFKEFVPMYLAVGILMLLASTILNRFYYTNEVVFSTLMFSLFILYVGWMKTYVAGHFVSKKSKKFKKK